MNETFKQIARWKKVDLIVQLVVFVISLLFVFAQAKIWILCAIAPLQIISCIFWSVFFARDKSIRYAAGSNIRTAFFVIIINIIVALLIPSYALILLYLMLIVGPMMGLLYFIITCTEFIYYKNARKPWYFYY